MACDTGSYKDVSGAGLCTECEAGKYGGREPGLLQWRVQGQTIHPWKIEWRPDQAQRALMSVVTKCRLDVTRSSCIQGEGYQVQMRKQIWDGWSAWEYLNYTGPTPVDWHIALTAAGFTFEWEGEVQHTFVPPNGMVFHEVFIPEVFLSTSNDVTVTSMVTGDREESTCVRCPAHSDSAAGALAATDCLCNAGYTGPDGGACVACDAGKYKMSTGSDACTDCVGGKYLSFQGASHSHDCFNCPSSSTSPSGSDKFDDCVCLSGFSGPNGGPCTQSGDPCPANSDAPEGSMVSTACTCNAGYTGPDGGTCVACAAGTYKAGTGDAACDACPANSASPAGSTVSTACTCNAGYTGPDGGQCHFVTSMGQWNCTDPTLARPIRVIQCGTSGSQALCPDASIAAGFGFYALNVYSGAYDGLFTIPAASAGGELSQVRERGVLQSHAACREGGCRMRGSWHDQAA